jgi:hypothetical protein
MKITLGKCGCCYAPLGLKVWRYSKFSVKQFCCLICCLNGKAKEDALRSDTVKYRGLDQFNRRGSVSHADAVVRLDDYRARAAS